MEIHPWHRLRGLAHVTLSWHDGGPMGETDHAAQTISLRRGMTYEQRRSTILHECLHAEGGATPAGLADKEEARVRRDSARLLLPDIRAVGEALAWAHTHEEAAYDLAVDRETLLTRLRHLHPAERAFLKRRLEDVGEP